MNKVMLLLLFVFVLCAPCFAQYNETLTIATYYPSPNGVYRTLRLNPSTQPAGVAGDMYYDSGDNLIKFHNDTMWVNMTGGGGGVSDPLQVRRIVVGDVNGNGNIDPADIPATSRPLYVHGPSGGVHTAAFVNPNRYGVAIGAEDGTAYASIQSARFLNGEGSSPSTTNLILNSDGGNVGIATAMPTQKLDVNGQINATEVCTTGGQCLSSVAGSVFACVTTPCTIGVPFTSCTVTCPAGYIVVGCTGASGWMTAYHPVYNGNGCSILGSTAVGGTVVGYARCCR